MADEEASNGGDWDSQRCLVLRKLPLSVLYDRERFDDKVKELLKTTFGLSIETAVRRETRPDGEVEAAVLFPSRALKNFVWQSRSKLTEGVELGLACASWEAGSMTSESVTSTVEKAVAAVAAEETLAGEAEEAEEGEEIEGSRLEILDSQERTPDEEHPEEEEDGGRPVGLEEEDEEAERKAALEECLEVHAEGMVASRSEEQREAGPDHDDGHDTSIASDASVKGEPGADRKHKGTDQDPDAKPDRRDRRPRERVWEGAPEFQWRVPETTQESSRLILDNVSMADLRSPFLYQSMTRAKTVNLNFINATTRGNFEHSVTRKGRLTLQFHSDTQAMAQAVNGLVFIRTPPNRPQIKTANTTNMSNLLEMKLGRVLEPHLKSRQLLVRDIAEDATEETLRSAVAKGSALESVELVRDVVKRRCAVLTYASPADAIDAHLLADTVAAGAVGRRGLRRHVKVFFMEDMVPKDYLLKPEAKQLRYQEQRAERESEARPRPSSERKREPRESSNDRDRSPKRSRRSYPSPSAYDAHRGASSYRGRGRGGDRGSFRGTLRGRGAPRGRGALLGAGPEESFRGARHYEERRGAYRGSPYTPKPHHHHQDIYERQGAGGSEVSPGVTAELRAQQAQIAQTQHLLTQQSALIAQLSHQLNEPPASAQRSVVVHAGGGRLGSEFRAEGGSSAASPSLRYAPNPNASAYRASTPRASTPSQSYRERYDPRNGSSSSYNSSSSYSRR